MNEREFLKKIKSKDNRNGENTTLTVIDFLNQNKMSIPTLFKRVYNKIFGSNSKVKTPEQIVSENFETIIGTFKDSPEDKELDEYRVLDFCNTLMERKDIKTVGKRIMTENIDKIYPMLQDGGGLFGLVQLEKKLGREINDGKDKLLQEKKLEVARYIIDAGDTMLSQEDKEFYSKTLSIMIDELLQSENCRYADISFFKKGGYSQVFQIGDKVLKIGRPREIYKIPNHRRLLQPLTRTNLLDRQDNPKACVEIQEAVSLEEKISKKELYLIYKELRDDGIIWTDARQSNVGKLKGENVPKLNGEKMDVAPNSVGFSDEKNGNDLTSGDWVIIDSDFIYRENDPDLEWSMTGLSEEFERKYQSEKAKKVSEEYMKRHQGEDIYSLPENQIRSHRDDESRT